MQKATFKIRRKIILAFLFSLLSVLIFSVFSFQVHREIGHRLRLLELTDDLFHNHPGAAPGGEKLFPLPAGGQPQ